MAARDSADRRIKARNETSYDFTPELLAEAARRLGWVGLAYAGASILAHYERWASIAWAGSVDWSQHVPAVFGAAAVVMGIAVYMVSRRGVLSPRRLLDLGLVFQVVGAMGIAAKEYWGATPPVIDGSFLLVPAECVWIVAYPLIVPNTPNKVLVASLLSASMGPTALALSSVVGGTPIDDPLAWATYFLSSNYLCVIVAYLAGRIVYGFSMKLKHARDVGSYELITRIGQGAMGEVWRAKHRLLVRPAAVKLIRRDVLGANERARDALVRRFEREARDTAALKSIHTIGVYDFGVMEEGDFYYAMELLDGLSLERFIQVYGPTEPARAVYLLRQVCHSLGEAHAGGLIHRDVKPANIFLCRLGPDDDFIKVLDFGIVKHGAGSGTVTMLTLDGGTVGTPAYMAPEIALGHDNVDGRADIYSLGCVAYYLLTGHTVFSGDTPVATALAHVQDEPIPPSERSEFDLPPALDSLVLECLAKDPAARPASAFILERRLAATVPHDAWTSAAAHAWWESHGAAITGIGPGSAETPAVDTQGTTDREPTRFWPRLERRPLIAP